MIVGICSPFIKETNSALVIALLALEYSMRYQERALIINTRQGIDPFRYIFNVHKIESENFPINTQALYRALKHSKLDKESLTLHVHPLLVDGTVDYIVDPLAFDHKALEEKLLTKKMLHIAREQYGLIFIDLCGQLSDQLVLAYELCDIIVYCSDQAKWNIDSLSATMLGAMRETTPVITASNVFKKKNCVLFLNYCHDYQLNKRQLRKMLQGSEVVFIPPNADILDMANHGRLEEYFARFYLAKGLKQHQNFFESLDTCVKQLFKIVEV